MMRRFDMRLPAVVRLPEAIEFFTETQNVSARGVFFYLDRAVSAGTKLEVTLTFPRAFHGACDSRGASPALTAHRDGGFNRGLRISALQRESGLAHRVREAVEDGTMRRRKPWAFSQSRHHFRPEAA